MFMFKKSLSFIHILAVVALVVVLAATFVACDGKNNGDGTIKLSFNSNGGEVPATITVQSGGTVALPELKDKTVDDVVYVFDGWSLNSDLSGEVYRGMVTAPKSDSTYYAKWAKGYLLTLDAGSGRLSQPSVYVKEGANLVETLKKYIPTPQRGLIFDKWMLNDEDLKASDVMPAESLTVVANYLVSYTVSYYLQQENALYQEDLTRRKSLSGPVGLQVSGEELVIDGYTYNAKMSAETERIALSDTADQNAVKLYYDIVGYHAIYHANPPAGTVARGQMNESIAFFGMPLKAAECEYTVEGYRFLGWADFEGGTSVAYEAGEDLDLTESDPVIDLYAVWQQGIADALGGKDYLFFDLEDDSVIYLLREGFVKEKKGSYDKTTHRFTFTTDAKEGDKTIVLSGVINGNTFYYFNDTLYKTFKTADGKHSITISENYAATYTDESNVKKQGKLNFDNNYYVFTSDDDDFIIRFVFEENEAGEKVIVIQNMDEAGYYATTEGYPVIYLDGFGGLKYYFDPEHPTYHDISGKSVLEADGFYTVNSKGYYECYSYVGDPEIETNRLEYFVFRITGEAPKQVGSYELKEKAIERSAFYGQLANNLYLDGFGGGTYTEQVESATIEHVGTYDILSDWWMSLGTNESTRTWLINFKYDGAEDNIYFALREDTRGRVTAEFFGSAPKGTESGIAQFEGPITLSGQTYDDAFIMFIIGAYDTTMVLVKVDEGTIREETVNIFGPVYAGIVTANPGQDKSYHFVSTNGEAQMNFKVTETTIAEETQDSKLGKVEFSAASGEGSLEKRVIDESIQLTVDPTTSTATYTENGVQHKDVPYTYSSSTFLEFYTFTVDAQQGKYLYYYRDVYEKNSEDGTQTDTQFVRVSGDRILDYAYYTDDLYYAFPARLLLTKGSNKAYIAIPMAVGEAAYVGEGTYTQVDGSENEYKFVATSLVDNLIDYFGGEGFEVSVTQFHEYYDEFTFRKVGGDANTFGKFYARFDDMCFDLANFKADGYTNEATYTSDEGAQVKGTFYMMEMIIVFTSGAGIEYRLKVEYDGETPVSAKNVSKDAGLYYFYDIDDTTFATFGPGEGGEMYDYIVFDGEDKVSIARYNDGYVASIIQGTMTKTEKWTENFREYKIEDEEGETFFAVLGTFKGIWGDLLDEEYLVYDVYNEAYNGEWETEDGGVLKGNGYRIYPASYDQNGDGIIDYRGNMVRASFQKDDTQTHAYTVDANGEVIVFNYEVDLETTISFVFNVVDDGDSYPHLIERKLRFGSYAYWELGKRPGGYMYLDGVGRAEIYGSTGNLLSKGSYGLDDINSEYGEASYWYKDDTDESQDFHFALALESESAGSTWFEYRKYTENIAGEYEADDWSHLSISGFGEIVYTDRYGVVYEGYYEYDPSDMFVITLYTYDGSGIIITISAINAGGDSFDYTSVTIEKTNPTPSEPSDEQAEESTDNQ